MSTVLASFAPARALNRPPSETEMIAKARLGDPAAFEEIVRTYLPRVLAIAQNMVGRTGDAEDVAQQTLLSVVNHIGEFRGDSHFASWLFSIARNHCIKQRTRGASGQPTQPLERVRDASLTQTSPGPEELFSKEQLASALDVAIAALEPAQREVLLLRDVEGLSATQVAQALGLSVDAVKSRLHRARKTLRDELAPWFEQTTPAPACPTTTLPASALAPAPRLAPPADRQGRSLAVRAAPYAGSASGSSPGSRRARR